MKKSQNLEANKDPENIYMSDIIHILKDQKQKIDHLLRQTRQGMQQSNSKVKGFWNSSNQQAEPFSIPSKVLNDIQGYETSAGRINSILHKKVNQLKRITMKKKTYEEIEKREREKEIFARFATPDVRMNMRGSIGQNILDQKQSSKFGKRYETSANTRAGSVQLDINQECLTTDGWSRRIQAAKQQHQYEEIPLQDISSNKMKQIGILRKRNNDQLKSSLDEITKIYSPRSQQSQTTYKQDQIDGQSMILDDQNVNRSLDMVRHTMDMGVLSQNSTKNKGKSNEMDLLLLKNQFIDKENNQQYLLKQVQQQNSILTQKQNEILYRQLLEDSKQIHQNSNEGKVTPTQQKRFSNSYQIAQSIQNEENSATTMGGDGFFLPSLNNKRQQKDDDQQSQQNSTVKGELNQDILSTQKKYSNYAYGNVVTPNNRSMHDQIKESQNKNQQNQQRLDDEDEDLSTQIRNFKKGQKNQQFMQVENIAKSKRSLSLQQNVNLENGKQQQQLVDTEDKLNLYNKYKQNRLIENSTLRLPSENEIYPLNIINADKSSDGGQNFFKRGQQQQRLNQEQIMSSEQTKKMIQGVKGNINLQERSQRYSYDLNCNSVQLNTNQVFQNDKIMGVSGNGNHALNAKNIQLSQDRFSGGQENGKCMNTNHISLNEKQEREYSYQDTNQENYKINSTDFSGKKEFYSEIVQERMKRNSQYNLNQDLSENIIVTQDFKTNHNKQEFKKEYSKQSCQQLGHKIESPPQVQSLKEYERMPKYDKTREQSEKHQIDSIKRENELENQDYEYIPSQINFTVKKEDLKIDLSKLAQKRQNEQDAELYKMQSQIEHQESQKQEPKVISNEQINNELKDKLKQNFLQRLGIPGEFLQKQQLLSKEKQSIVRKNIKSNNLSRDGGFQSPSKQGSESARKMDLDSTYRQRVKFNDPNLFNYHKLIGCANLDDKNKKIKPYQHYHSNERENLEKKYFEMLNEKLNYQIEINLLFLEQSLLKSKSQTKKQLLEKLKAFRQEIVEASQAQEKSIQNLKNQYKHLHTFNLPDSLFTI